MYLKKWTPDFNLDEDIPTTILVWVEFPRLPLSCWSDDYLWAIDNGVGRYLDRVEKKYISFHA